ncbi:hypothetical protein BOX15_Mlig000483g2, partial [Macrostomum lignano]
YESWESLRKRIYDRFRNTADRCWQRSVLHAYPPDVGRQVAACTVKSLYDSVINRNNSVCLDTQQEVAWTMEAICYGLTLPFSRASPADTDETVSRASRIYCHWLGIMLLPEAELRDEVTIPRMLKEDPNLYCRRMLAHLFNVFVPRRDLTGGGRSAAQFGASQPSLTSALVDRGGSGGGGSVGGGSSAGNILGSGGGGAVADDGLRYQLTVCKNVLLKCVEITEKSRIITPETWETILEFLLIVNDVILTEPRDSKEQSMALRQHSLEDSKRSKSSVNTFKEALAEDHWAEQCKRVIDVLMRTWLLACRNHFPRPPLWKTFRELLAGWRHHEEVAAKWGDAVRELTESLLGGAKRSPHQLVCSELGQETVRQAWFRVLHLMPSPADLCSPVIQSSAVSSSSADILSRRHPVEDSAARSRQLPAIFNQLVCVLSDVASQLLGARRQQKQHGNSLLHLIGSWLFDCAGVSDPAYQLGRAEACGCLCRLFANCRPDFLPVYLARFYAAMFNALEPPLQPLLLNTVVYHSQGLLSAGLKGVHVLLPSYFKAVHYILKQDSISNLPSGVPTPVDLQRSAVRLLLSMIALPNHFGQSEILHPSDSRSAPRTFLSLRQDIVVLVLDTLLLLRDSHCVQMLLCALLCIAEDLASYENLVHSDESCTDAGVRAVPKAPDSVQKLFTQAVAAICKRLNLEHDSALKMDYDTTLTALDVLSHLARLPIGQSSFGGPHNTQNLLKSCVRWLCDFISSQCARPRQEHSRYLHSQIVATYDCLAQWALNYPQLLLDEDTLICLLEIIELGLSGSKSRVEHRGEATRFEPKWRKQKSPHSARLAQAAECLLSLIMSQVGAFPPALGPQTAYGSLLTEESFPDCRRRYLALNGSLILAVLEPVSQKRTLPSAIVIVRGPFGRQVWQAEMRDAPRQQRPPAAPQSARRPPPDPSLLPYWCYTEGRRAPPYFPAEPPGLPAVRADASVPTLASVTPNSAEVLRLMAQARVPKRLPCPETPQCRPPASAKEFQPARLILTQLGLLDIACTLDSSTQEFFDQLSELDGLPVRSLHPAALYFVPRGACASDPDRLLAVSSAAAAASADFTSFCHGLGWAPANLPGNVAYWSDAVAEVVFHRPSGRPLEQSQPVLVWLEDAEDRAAFPTDALCPRADPLVFVACRDRLLKVLEVSMGPNANCKPAAPLDFAPPLLKGLVVPLRTAPCLVRQAILNWSARRRLHMAYAASGHGKSSTGSPDPGEPFPHTIRQRKIQEIQRSGESVRGDSLLLMLMRAPDSAAERALAH